MLPPYGCCGEFTVLLERVREARADTERAYAFQADWPAVDRLLEVAASRQMREFGDGLACIRAKREPTRENIHAWFEMVTNQVRDTGGTDVSRLVCAAHLGLVDFWMATDTWPDCVDQVPYDFKAECARVRGVAREPFGF